ncbi:SNF2 family N-terminal domain protein [Spraguea lophii 42_110]|uniref:SNF2 family N-terminal domain protein n=1 Tax=Spraguea lophii (strain 42_110) TaxID=1358809 RepID=S7XJ90_SPRLO|nr:SNF2 family N-terminal domain protein [Spraguea lophii 42_110]
MRRKIESDSSTTDIDDASSEIVNEDVEYASSSSVKEEFYVPKKRGRPRKYEKEVDNRSYMTAGSPLGSNFHPSKPMFYRNLNLKQNIHQNFQPVNFMRNQFFQAAQNRNVEYPMYNMDPYSVNNFPSSMGSYNPSYAGNIHMQGYYKPLTQGYLSPTLIQESYTQPPSYVPKKQKETVYADNYEFKTTKRRRKSAVKFEKKVEDDEEETSKEEEYSSEVEQDPHEKLLDYNEEKDEYLVKIRFKSYLHCEWIKREEIAVNKTGLIKIKRFRKKDIPYDPDFIKVDRVIKAEKTEEGTMYLIKWKKLVYELSTFEFEDDVKDLENFDVEYEKYKHRNKLKALTISLNWRPTKEQFLKFEESPTFKNENKLREYQLEGLNWFLNRWYARQGCIMADEMGLGKTVQSVTFISTIYEKYNFYAPILVVAPLSTIIHWEREFLNWTNLRVLVFHGSNVAREMMYEYEFYSKDRNLLLFDVIITTYEMVMSGLKYLSDINFGVAIFDEAHRLKNANSKATLTLKSLNINHKVLLSGTPLQNNIQELWALLNFIDPMKYESCNNFLEEYKLEKSEDVERLQNLLRPLMLRRMKDDVEKSIPMKEETIVTVELTMIQKRYYRAILEKNLEFLTKGGTENAPNLLNVMMELRKCCIHPFLVRGAEDKIIDEYLQKNKADISEENVNRNTGEQSILNRMTLDEYYKVIIQSSGKLVLLDKLLKQLKGKHKVLIFSQMTKCLDLLADYLNYRQFKYERIDGGVRGDCRQAAIDRFCDKNSDVFVFLLCTRAGGVGINLTAADTVIIFDSDWNPQNDLQAQARCHRIGQTNEVKIYRLITNNTYEREMFDKAGLKLGLDRAVLQRMDYEGEKKMKKREAIEYLLKKGAYGVLMEDDEAAQKFCEENIEEILQRRTHVVKHNDGGNIFSRASFKIDEEIDDPEFWNNMLSKRKVEEDELTVKKQIRKLARDGNLSESELKEIEDKRKELLDKLDNNENTEEEAYLLVFLTALKKGTKAISTIKNLPNAHSMLNEIIKFLVDKIEEKFRKDYIFTIEKFIEETTLEKDKEFYNSIFYEKFYEKFLLRIQAVYILSMLNKVNTIVKVNRSRGWSVEDDKRLINWTLNNGYDNYPATVGLDKGAFKGKPIPELNQRIRKIMMEMNRREVEQKEENTEYDIIRCICIFGRKTENNKKEIKKYLNDDFKIQRMNTMVEEVLKRRKRGEEEKTMRNRIFLFDRINRIDMNIFNDKMKEMYEKKKYRKVKNLSIEENKVLIIKIKECGLQDTVLKEYGLTEEAMIKKLESITDFFRSDEE